MSERSNKFCTQCGSGLASRKTSKPLTELYDEELFAKSKILKLVECRECGEVADKYVEHDGALVLIDLLLQSVPAYRHVLFNGEKYRGLVHKMALLAVICDGYVSWASLPDSGEFFEQEYLFYVMCSRAIFALLGFCAIPLIILSVVRKFRNEIDLHSCFLGLLMAYSSRFCNISALLWAFPTEDEVEVNRHGSQLMWGFLYLLFFIASVRSLQVTSRLRLTSSLILTSLAHIAFNLILHYDLIRDPISCE